MNAAYKRSYLGQQCLHSDLFVRMHGCWYSPKPTFNQPSFHLQMLTLYVLPFLTQFLYGVHIELPVLAPLAEQLLFPAALRRRVDSRLPHLPPGTPARAATQTN